jgi:hypothetical protein
MKLSNHKCEKCGKIYGCWCFKEHHSTKAKYDCGCQPVIMAPPQGHSVQMFSAGNRSALALSRKVR